jgi:hypothetical protein
MDWTKLPGFAKTAMAAARIVAAGAVGMAALAGALLIVGPALPGHVAPWWVSAQARIQAIGGGVGPPACFLHARRYRANPAYVPPTWCLNTAWFRGLPSPPGEAAPPPGDAP